MSQLGLPRPNQPLPARLPLQLDDGLLRKFSLPHARVMGLVLIASLLAGLTGCGSDDEVRRYQAAKITAVAEDGDSHSTANQRMLAAIVLREGTAWFFKMVGPQDAVGEQVDHFRSLLQSLQFAGGEPKWTLPEGWNQQPASGIRHATLLAKSGDKELEVSVTSLPKTAEDNDQAYYLANINRWRGQLQLSPLAAAALADQSEQIDFQGGTAVFVDLVGKSSADGGATRPPFAGMNSGARPDVAQPEKSATLKFEKPDGWEDAELVVSRGGITLRHEAAFSASDGDQQVDITVDRMPSLGGLLANVNRWRRQVGLPPQDEAAFRDSVRSIELADKRGAYVQFVGGQETILGVIAEHDGQAWFIKLKGDNELAQAQQQRFEAFVRSIRFE